MYLGESCPNSSEPYCNRKKKQIIIISHVYVSLGNGNLTTRSNERLAEIDALQQNGNAARTIFSSRCFASCEIFHRLGRFSISAVMRKIAHVIGTTRGFHHRLLGRQTPAAVLHLRFLRHLCALCCSASLSTDLTIDPIDYYDTDPDVVARSENSH